MPMKIASSGSADLLTLCAFAFFFLADGFLTVILENKPKSQLLSGAITIGLTTTTSNIVITKAMKDKAVEFGPNPKKLIAMNVQITAAIVTGT